MEYFVRTNSLLSCNQRLQSELSLVIWINNTEWLCRNSFRQQFIIEHSIHSLVNFRFHSFGWNVACSETSRTNHATHIKWYRYTQETDCISFCSLIDFVSPVRVFMRILVYNWVCLFVLALCHTHTHRTHCGSVF